MAKKKTKKSKRDKDLFSQLREKGVGKSAADQISKAAAAADSGKDKAGEALAKAAEDLRALAADLEKRIPGHTKALERPGEHQGDRLPREAHDEGDGAERQVRRQVDRLDGEALGEVDRLHREAHVEDPHRGRPQRRREEGRRDAQAQRREAQGLLKGVRPRAS